MSLANRRQRRTEVRGSALDMLLESCRKRRALRALVISDERGLLVAASGSAVDPVDVAAVLPEPSRHSEVSGLRASSFRSGGHTLYVGALGGDAQIPDLVDGARRILAS
jgi:hypothetical protein